MLDARWRILASSIQYSSSNLNFPDVAGADQTLVDVLVVPALPVEDHVNIRAIAA